MLPNASMPQDCLSGSYLSAKEDNADALSSCRRNLSNRMPFCRIGHTLHDWLNGRNNIGKHSKCRCNSHKVPHAQRLPTLLRAQPYVYRLSLAPTTLVPIPLVQSPMKRANAPFRQFCYRTVYWHATICWSLAVPCKPSTVPYPESTGHRP